MNKHFGAFDLTLTDALIDRHITAPSLVIVLGGSPAGLLLPC